MGLPLPTSEQKFEHHADAVKMKYLDISRKHQLSYYKITKNDSSIFHRLNLQFTIFIFLFLLKVCAQGVLNVVTGELIVSSPDEITRERLEVEATLLDSVVRETECEAITEREDTYEVIIDNGVEIESENFSIGIST